MGISDLKKIGWLGKGVQFSLFALFFFLPFERIPTIDFAGYTVKISYILALVLLAALFFHQGYKRLFQDRLMPADYALLLFWLVACLSLVASPGLKRSIIIVLMWSFVFCVHLVITRLLNYRTLRERAESFVIASAIFVCIFGLYQFLADSAGVSMEFTGLKYLYTKAIFGFPRIQSVALEPLYLGNFLLVPLFLAIRKYIVVEKDKRSWQILLLILTTLVLGIARGVYIAILFSFALLFIYLKKKSRQDGRYWYKAKGIARAFFFSIVIAVGLIFLSNGIQATRNFVDHARINDTKQGESVPGRIATFKKAWTLFLARPILGNGVGSFGLLSARKPVEIEKLGYGTVNNEYLEILTETGAVGLILFVAFLFFVLRDVKHSYNRKDLGGQVGLFILFLGLLAIFTQYNFFSTLYVMHIWVFLAWLRAEALPERELE